MQGVQGEFDSPPPKDKFQVNRKLVFYGIVITIIILLALFAIPVKSHSDQGSDLNIKLEPSFEGDYYVYFPLFINKSPRRVNLPIQGNGTIKLIYTQYGLTLNVSGNGPLSVKGNIDFDRDKKAKIWSIKENDYVIFINKFSYAEGLFVNLRYHVWTGGTESNIFGIKTLYWSGAGPSLRGNATFEDEGWQTFTNLSVR